MVYSKSIAKQLTDAFYVDLKESAIIDAEVWLNRPKYVLLWERAVGLLSPFL